MQDCKLKGLRLITFCHFAPFRYPSHRRPCLSEIVLPGQKGTVNCQFDLAADDRTRGPELRLFRSNYGLNDLHLFGAVNMGTRVTAATLVEARDATCCDFQGHRLAMGSANGSLTVFDRAPNETTWQPTASWPAHDTAVAQVLCNQGKGPHAAQAFTALTSSACCTWRVLVC